MRFTPLTEPILPESGFALVFQRGWSSSGGQGCDEPNLQGGKYTRYRVVNLPVVTLRWDGAEVCEMCWTWVCNGIPPIRCVLVSLDECLRQTACVATALTPLDWCCFSDVGHCCDW